MRSILLQPHDDDAFLFACFTAIRERPLIVTVFDSYLQPARGIPGTMAAQRAEETRQACQVLGLQEIRLGFRDDDTSVTGDRIFGKLYHAFPGDYAINAQIVAPDFEKGGHEQHNLVAEAADGLNVVGRYLTYTRQPCQKTSRTGHEVPFEPDWVALKLRALACFKSQFQTATGCAEHFIGRSLREYIL